MLLKRAQGQSVVASGELRSASHGEGHTARTSITDDGRTHPPSRTLENRVFPCSRSRSRAFAPSRKEWGAMSSHKGDGWGTSRTLETSHRDGTRDAPQEGDLYGNGVPILVVGATALKARMGEPSQGRRGTGGRTTSSHGVRQMRRARVALKSLDAERREEWPLESARDTETVTLRSERGGWKRVIARWYLAGRLLNLAYLF